MYRPSFGTGRFHWSVRLCWQPGSAGEGVEGHPLNPHRQAYHPHTHTTDTHSRIYNTLHGDLSATTTINVPNGGVPPYPNIIIFLPSPFYLRVSWLNQTKPKKRGSLQFYGFGLKTATFTTVKILAKIILADQP